MAAFYLPDLDLTVDVTLSEPRDVVIFVVSDEEIVADRQVLAAASPYFNDLLSTGITEAPLEDLDPETFQRIVRALYGDPIKFRDTDDVSHIFGELHRFNIMYDKVNAYLRDVLPDYATYDAYVILVGFYHDNVLPDDYIDSVAKTIHEYVDLSIFPPITAEKIILSPFYRPPMAMVTTAEIVDKSSSPHLEDVLSRLTRYVDYMKEYPNRVRFISLDNDLANILNIMYMPDSNRPVAGKLYREDLLVTWFDRYIDQKNLGLPVPTNFIDFVTKNVEFQTELLDEVNLLRPEFLDYYAPEGELKIDDLLLFFELPGRNYLVEIDTLLRDFFFPDITDELPPLYAQFIYSLFSMSEPPIESIEDLPSDDDLFALATEYMRLKEEL